MRDGHFAVVFDNADRGMGGRQDHPVIEAVDDPLKFITDGNKVEHVVVLIERAMDFRGDVVIVTMERLADVVVVRDEVSRTEDEAFFFEFDAISFRQSLCSP
jgi:hypothetical protein